MKRHELQFYVQKEVEQAVAILDKHFFSPEERIIDENKISFATKGLIGKITQDKMKELVNPSQCSFNMNVGEPSPKTCIYEINPVYVERWGLTGRRFIQQENVATLKCGDV